MWFEQQYGGWTTNIGNSKFCQKITKAKTIILLAITIAMLDIKTRSTFFVLKTIGNGFYIGIHHISSHTTQNILQQIHNKEMLHNITKSINREIK